MKTTLKRVAKFLAPPGTRRRDVLLKARDAYRNRHARAREIKQRGRRIFSRIVGRGIFGLPLIRTRALPEPGTPAVSILVPVHNKITWTLMCLASLAKSGDSTRFEVIVINDASTDSTEKRLSKIKNLRILNLRENLGFLRACNRGLQEARGEFVVYLNNDTQVQPGWLDALMKNFEDPLVGLVGAKLVYPDGRLQEAGGIVFSDASGWNYGRFDDPHEAPYSHRRDVDYVSGAAIAVRKSILDFLEGFDDRFAPAYYEDTDLAFAVRKMGFRVVFDPASVVIHHEGISHGTDLNSGHKAYQVANKEKFLAKWALDLQGHDAPGEISIHRSARRIGRTGGTVLVLDEYPTWNHDSGSKRLFEVLKAFRHRGFNVTLIPLTSERIAPYDSLLSEQGIQVWHSALPEAQEYIRAIADDIVLAFVARPQNMERYLQSFAGILPAVPVVFDTVDLHFLRNERELALEGKRASHEKRAKFEEDKRRELEYMRRANLTLVVSQIEKDLLERLEPTLAIELLSNVHQVIDSVPQLEGREGILFVGNFKHGPNLDGIDWFVREVLPIVREERPDVSLTIVGRPKPESIAALGIPHLRVTGWVEDLEPLYAKTRITIAPLRFGAGVKGKVGESWAHGVPVVMTSIAAEGMGVTHELNGLIADQPKEFAACVLRLLGDDLAWDSMSVAVHGQFEAHLSHHAFESAIDRLLEKCKLALR